MTPAAPDRAPTRGRRVALVVLWLLAGGAVALMVLLELTRPVAPPVTAQSATRWFDDAHLAAAEAFTAPLRPVVVGSLGLRVAVAAAVLLAARGPLRRVADRIGRPVLGAGLLAAATWVAVDLVRLPLVFWASYVHERAHGLRTQSAAGWLGDWLLGVGPVWVAVLLVALAAAWVVQRLPRAWPPVLGLGLGVSSAVVFLLGPVVLEPLLLDFTPVPDGPVAEAVRDLAARADVDLDEVLVADASRRTTRENAYVSGLAGTRRLVLYDTLLAARDVDVVRAVVAHELGHELDRDLDRAAVQAVGGAVVTATALWLLVGRRLRRADGRVDPLAGAVATAVLVLLLVVARPVELWASRRAEAAADQWALALLEDPAAYRAMQVGLATANLADPEPPTWQVWLTRSHPPPVERLSRSLLPPEPP